MHLSRCPMMYGNYYFPDCGLPFVEARFHNLYRPSETLGVGVDVGRRTVSGAK